MQDDKKPEDDQAFINTVQGLLRTPPKPHKDEQPKGKKDGRSKPSS